MLTSSLVSKKAQIILETEQSIPVSLESITEAGAVIIVDNPYALPEAFTLKYRRDKAPCRVMWRQPNQVGVRFEQP
ncbi:hypothetical protein M446_2135 [Methylobacterium sp. 4-46]|uniref:hypothetical protein n=1 Tax=unclassified Methylobacterium TaxID=2615210 RepID=UPI000152E509|nr:MULTISPECIES: hypothetical protein [Methylobacterium]ACA16597.1 hypothetical protein M446_2135 [Methylobacterium sp. 4-46]WFT82301.1 hypothetical protein QA634_10820 [Methylobacterium nodulans]